MFCNIRITNVFLQHSVDAPSCHFQLAPFKLYTSSIAIEKSGCGEIIVYNIILISYFILYIFFNKNKYITCFYR
jgi:hypothetical protein